MGKISDKDQQTIRQMFEQQMQDDVQIRFFTSENTNCDYCQETKEILQEIVGLNDKIKLEIYDLESSEAKRLGIDRVPATIFLNQNGEDTGVHFYGIPSGYEFSTLIEDIVDMSAGKTEFSDELLNKIAAVNQDVTLQVFVTPT